ncbi:MAG: 2-amino-4-hydroxy-6-hydroxymethyldihydropteridine diphosphokinase [Bdellovibrionales bacterium]|nr:2-amino-4-hydroxy-6-hydroxymethyldihydropteridine diphosphokinase [Bdellovibrionales bacterium]
MSLIIAIGSNLENPLENLQQARKVLASQFKLIAESQVYKSAAVDYEAQPDFFNQVLEYQIPALTPDQTMSWLLEAEKNMGRTRDISRGPRTIDMDIILWGLETHHTKMVDIPHPRWLERSFVIRPLQELPFFKTIEKCFTIPRSFKIEAFPV